ncbi:nucleotide exchange factor GrpE [Plantibacter sp. PA-3-X8]|uniref:nucleotide exchange factor GrpE n=1 Tax=Plantibacter TaxID=190323 RepID=UPI000F5E1EFC|nr:MULTISPECIES: nucleotide exchange factor GrpE [Plantibacter]AZH82750.1 nucleotide exchange factor GrpE [Plantibacter sp. PA-3-X8]TKJ99259.1 nucleotide exchange factor GrpE [Plantibacter flavus]
MTDENQNQNQDDPIIPSTGSGQAAKHGDDPETGEVRQPGTEGADADASAPSGAPAESADADAPAADHELTVEDILNAAPEEPVQGGDLSPAEQLAAERLGDLQRVTAEYANYRKRTEAGREVERERTTGEVAKVLLPVLDDLDRADKHGDLEGDAPFTQIAAKLRGAAEKLGLKPFGAVGETFDPNVHEAIFQQPTPGAEGETVLDVVETGYHLGSTLLRAAKVVVAVPAS